MTNLSITAVEFDQWESTFIKTTIELASGIEISPCRYVDDRNLADVLLVNVDSARGREFLARVQALTAEQSPLVVACSELPAEQSAGHRLQRPITYTPFISLLKNLRGIPPRKSTTVVQDGSLSRPTGETEPAADLHAADTPSAEAHEAETEMASAGTGVDITNADGALATQTDEGDGEVAEAESAQLSIEEELAEDLAALDYRIEDGDIVYSGADATPQGRGMETNLPARVDPMLTADEVSLAGAIGDYFLARELPARRFYEATRYLGIVNAIISQGEATEITHYQYPPVRVYPDQRLYMTPGDKALGSKMFRTLASEFVTHPLADPIPDETDPAHESNPLWKLLYNAALHGSEGRLREKANLHDKLRLIEEPDFGMVADIREHRIISKYMREHLADLSTIAVETDVALSIVIDFTNACDEVLLLERVPTAKRHQLTAFRPAEAEAETETAEEEQPQPEQIPIRKSHDLLQRFRSLFKQTG